VHAPAPPPPAPESPAPAQAEYSTTPAARGLQSLAAVAATGGATRYDLPEPVTVPDKSATMVMLLSRPVSGEALFLFAPDGGVADSASHPFRVARFTNTTAGLLERGPIAVFEQGAFLGQGMVEPLPIGATATVPFALERGIAIDSERARDQVGERIARIENGALTIDRDRVLRTTYRIRNGGDTAAKVVVKHAREADTRLFAPPAGTDDNVGTRSALVPATALPHATTEVVVDERAPEAEAVDWFSPVADSAVKAYVADPKADAAIARALGAAWRVRDEVVKKRSDRADLQQQATDLSEST
jgi:hypothetical protein